MEGRLYLAGCEAVEVEVPPVGDVWQQVAVVDGVTVQVDTVPLDQQDHVCPGQKERHISNAERVKHVIMLRENPEYNYGKGEDRITNCVQTTF